MKKHCLYILLVGFVSACASPAQEAYVKDDPQKDRKREEITQSDKVWQCRDYVYDDHIALELTKTSVTVGDVMEKVLDETLRKNDASIEDLKKDESARKSLNQLKEFYAGSIQLSGEEPEGAVIPPENNRGFE